MRVRLCTRQWCSWISKARWWLFHTVSVRKMWFLMTCSLSNCCCPHQHFLCMFAQVPVIVMEILGEVAPIAAGQSLPLFVWDKECKQGVQTAKHQSVSQSLLKQVSQIQITWTLSFANGFYMFLQTDGPDGASSYCFMSGIIDVSLDQTNPSHRQIKTLGVAQLWAESPGKPPELGVWQKWPWTNVHGMAYADSMQLKVKRMLTLPVSRRSLQSLSSTWKDCAGNGASCASAHEQKRNHQKSVAAWHPEL